MAVSEVSSGITGVIVFLEKSRRIILYLVSLVLTALAVYVAGFGVQGIEGFIGFDEITVRGLAVGLSCIISIFMISISLDKQPETRGYIKFAVNLLMVVITVVSIIFAILIVLEQEFAFIDLEPRDFLIGTLGLVVIFELTRRRFGLPLFVVCLLFFLYALFGQYLPWIFKHGGFTFNNIVEVLWYQDDGVWGRPTAVVSQVVLVFIVFGVILEGAGAGRVILKIAYAATGRLVGGPAHAAIVASGLFGTLSGSVIANVVSTGVFTIPTIRKYGFSNRFSGGVEAAASTGGQIVPPVMGVVAFLIADAIEIPYLTVAVAAIIPAMFFYGSLFTSVVVEARRQGLKPVSSDEREHLTREDYIQSLIFIIPLIIIVWVLIKGRSAALAGYWAVVAALVLGFILNPKFRSPKQILDTLVKAGQTSSSIMIVVAAVGIIIGAVNLTGLGQRFAESILTMIGTNLFGALALVMLGCLLLGMGMPTGAAYLTVIAVLGPILTKLGVPLLAAHLFMAYFAVLSAVTPPVAVGAFAAAPIAHSSPMATAVDAVRLSIAGFVIPFVFAFYPDMLLVLDFQILPFIWIILRTALSVWLISTSLGGYERYALPIWSRLLRLVSAITVLWTDNMVAVFGLVLGVALLVIENYTGHRRATTANLGKLSQEPKTP